MSISFMLSLMLSSVAMVSLEKRIHNNVKVKTIFFLKIYPRLSTTNIRKYRDCLMNVGSCPTILLGPDEKIFFSKNKQIFEILFTFLCFEGSIEVEAVVGEDGTQ